MSRWILLSGDASGIPALYARKLDSTTYACVELNAWEDLDSSAVATHGKYNVQAGTVDLASDQIARALRFVGLQFDGHGTIVNESAHYIDPVAEPGTRTYERVIVEALWGYGAKDVACDVSGNNLRKLVREAKGSV